MEQQANEPTSLGISNAAAYLGISPDQMRKLGDTGIIPMTRTLGNKKIGHRRFYQSDLDVARSLMHIGLTHDQIREHFMRSRQGVVNG